MKAFRLLFALLLSTSSAFAHPYDGDTCANSQCPKPSGTATPTPTPAPPTESVALAKVIDQDHSETDFANIDNLKSCSDGGTDVTLVASSDSSVIVASQLEFSPTVPVGATIHGVIFHLENYNDLLASGVATINLGWALHLNGTNLGSFRFADIPIDDGSNNYDEGDGTSSLGFTLSAATVRDVTFGFKFKFGNTSTKFAMRPSVSCVKISIYWTP